MASAHAPGTSGFVSRLDPTTLPDIGRRMWNLKYGSPAIEENDDLSLLERAHLLLTAPRSFTTTPQLKARSLSVSEAAQLLSDNKD